MVVTNVGKIVRSRGPRVAWAGSVFSWLVALGLASSCASAQVGLVDLPASVEPPQQFVLFEWHPDNSTGTAGSMTGSMTGRLADGTRYQGKYFRVGKQADPSRYASAWEGWAPYWPEWTGASDWSSFRQRYAEKVIANFHATRGHARLRCSFDLTRPAAGLSAGASGACQSSDHQAIDGVVMPSRLD